MQTPVKWLESPGFSQQQDTTYQFNDDIPPLRQAGTPGPKPVL